MICMAFILPAFKSNEKFTVMAILLLATSSWHPTYILALLVQW